MATEPTPGGLVPHTRAVSSACDSCKRRKLKCSGDQPCTRCSASAVVCTYGHATARLRPVDYIRHLESRVADLEARLRDSNLPSIEKTTGDVRCADPESRASSSQGQVLGVPDGIDTLVGPDNDLLSSSGGSATYNGEFASLNVLRIVRDKCDRLANIIAPLSSGRILAEAFAKDTVPLPKKQAIPPTAVLPDLAESRRLCHVAIEEALPCHECIDREAFFGRLVAVHVKKSEELGPDERAFLALVFALLGFAKRFEADNYNYSTVEAYPDHHDDHTVQGWDFYQSSMDIVHQDDLCSLDLLRAIIYQVLFLSASYMLSKAYTRLSTGVATAIRIGLHVSSPSLGSGSELSAEQTFRRRQVFSVLFAIDTYLASTLGLPKLFHQVDTDQIFPLRDEDLHDHGMSLVRRNPHTPEAETLVGCRILVIMAEIHTRRIPFSKGMMIDGHSKTYQMTSQEVASLDAQLAEWYQSLPPVEGIPLVKRALHAQLVIRYTYAATLMHLHRPFLHHLVRKADDSTFHMDGYAYGSHCITAAMQCVWLLQRLDDQGLLHESVWFYTSSLSLAASSLIFFVLGSPYSATVQDATEAAFNALGLLQKLGQKNEAARRCFESINSLMSQANLEKPYTDTHENQACQSQNSI